eukprot:CAMPEP_0174366286 /NCGR_PEP_ID=MMETSP0811_2-20130205/80632_1 /TAXON_ID=73025 ORGANISM="Eutreptiella gymnastica-like, Strain CCMP1594" /NCGR_SAMPLE_ID=MMETSP0811_2 /ASSEMBLY_ACC=CAM_ASM_000667 /LENGTH=73 /DNA_ID=CAMNT_0015507707 /DNA_START=108 /DNA_END=329 /DNA_ORIENTATION=+
MKTRGFFKGMGFVLVTLGKSGPPPPVHPQIPDDELPIASDEPPTADGTRSCPVALQSTSGTTPFKWVRLTGKP